MPTRRSAGKRDRHARLAVAAVHPVVAMDEPRAGIIGEKDRVVPLARIDRKRVLLVAGDLQGAFAWG